MATSVRQLHNSFPDHSQTRRALLAKAGLVAGTMGAMGAMADRAAAHHTSPAPQDFDGYLSVKHFGALGNGSNDDTDEINNCIAAAVPDPGAGNFGAAVYFPPGQYIISSPIVLRSNCILVGHGSLSQIIAADSFTGKLLDTLGGNPVSDVYVHDLAFDARGKPTVDAIGIRGSSSEPCRRIFLERVEVKNHTNTAADRAIFVRLTEHGAIRDCYVHETTRVGIAATFCTDFVIEGNFVERCGDDGIAVIGSGNVIGRNIIDASTAKRGAGIAVVGSGTVGENVCLGGVHAGIEFRSDSSDCVIEDNVILEAGNTSAEVGPDGSPSWGTPKGSGVCALNSIATPMRRLLIRDNLIYAPRNHGVVLAAQNSGGGITDVAISGNMIWCGPPASIRNPSIYTDSSLAGTGVTAAGGPTTVEPLGAVTEIQVTDNEIRDPTGPGVYAKGSNNKRWAIRDNLVLNSKGNATAGVSGRGIAIDGIEAANVTANRAHDTQSTKTQEYGLEVKNMIGKSLVTANDFTENKLGAISESNKGATSIVHNLGGDLNP